MREIAIPLLFSTGYVMRPLEYLDVRQCFNPMYNKKLEIMETRRILRLHNTGKSDISQEKNLPNYILLLSALNERLVK
jgi:hypothetical protein